MMKEITFSINGKNYNLYDKDVIGFSFFNTKNRHFLQKGLSNIGIDLLAIGLVAMVADKTISREKTENAWTRTIEVVFPVIEYDIWSEQTKLLEKTLSFLSGDNWNISFSKRVISSSEDTFSKKYKAIKKSTLKDDDIIDIAMFSGGLDSYIGAIDRLESSRKCVFVNIHGGGNSFENDFINCRNSLSSYFGNKNLNEFFRTYSVCIKNTTENSTRCRSFTFFTHALALSTCFNNVERLVIPENGTISLNVPLTPGRYGSNSTRTTHPFYIKCLQELTNNIGLNIKLVNPYQFQTKGEMIINCKNQKLLLGNIGTTMSCSHPTSGRWKHNGSPSHCGYCLPCFIRMAAEIKGYGRIITKTRVIENETKDTQSTYRCIKYKLAHKDRENPVVQIIKNGPIDHNIKQFKDLYIRSLEELELIIKHIESKNK